MTTFIAPDGQQTELPGSCIIEGGTLVLPEGYIHDGYVVIEQGRITAVSANRPGGSERFHRIDARGAYVAPGLVDIHIHGCGEYSFDSIDPSGFDGAIDFLASRGVTTFCPTVQPDETVLRSLAAILTTGVRTKAVSQTVPGLYLEGPFVHPEKRGGILPDFLRPPDSSYLEHLLRLGRGHLSMMTLAPELHGTEELLTTCAREGIRPCFGHSTSSTAAAADLARSFLANEAGLPLGITHLFNGMSPISHKQSGLAALPFLYREPYVELNGDRLHVNDEMLQLCYSYLNHDRLMLISDAVVSAGLHAGLPADLPAGRSAHREFVYFNQKVLSGERGVRYKADDTLVGSNALLPDSVRSFMRATGAPLYKALRFAALNPSSFLGIDDTRGSLTPGKNADILLLDSNLDVGGVLKSGVPF